MMVPADMRRLRSLVLLLGSPSDGDSLHDLADNIAPAVAMVDNLGLDASWRDLTLWLSVRSDALTAKQANFVATMTAHNPDNPPSPAQLEWLHGLVERVTERAQNEAA